MCREGRLADLDFEDNLALLIDMDTAQREKVTLCISQKKTTAMAVAQNQTLWLLIVGKQGTKYVESFTYPESNIKTYTQDTKNM